MSSSGSDSEEFESADEGDAPEDESLKEHDEGYTELSKEVANLTDDLEMKITISSSSPDEYVKVTEPETGHTEEKESPLVSSDKLSNELSSEEKDVCLLENHLSTEITLTGQDDIPTELIAKVSTRKVPAKERTRSRPTLGAKKLGAVKIPSTIFSSDGQLSPASNSKSCGVNLPKAAKEGDELNSSSKNVQVSQETVTSTTQESDGSWGWWGPPKSLFTSVASLTSQLLNTVEAGLNIPDPEELARQDNKTNGVDNANENISDKREPKPSSSGLALPFMGGVESLTRLVESTGTRVLSTGLDTLELLGKKTMNVLQEKDPGLKKARATILNPLGSNQPCLSQVLREAKDREAFERQMQKQNPGVLEPVRLSTLFDQHQGLVHLEALEMLSEQYRKRVHSLLANSDPQRIKVCKDFQDICDLNDDFEDNVDVDPHCPDFDALEETLATTLLTIVEGVSCKKLMKEVRYGFQRFQEEKSPQMQILGVDSLARLTSSAVEIYHKCGEFLVLENAKNKVGQAEVLADSFLRLTTILRTEIQRLAEFYVFQLVEMDALHTHQSTDIYMEASNCCGYLKNALRLMIPILQFCALN